MGIPLLDVHDPQPHYPLELAIPLSVLHGANTISTGGFIHIDAHLRLGSSSSQERMCPTTIQIAKSQYNLHISLLQNQTIFSDDCKHYCIVTGKKPEDPDIVADAVSDDDDNDILTTDIDEKAAEEVLLPEADIKNLVPVEDTDELNKIQKELKKRKVVVLLDRLDQDKKPVTKPTPKKQKIISLDPSAGSSRRFPARKNRMSRLKDMEKDYEVPVAIKEEKETKKTKEADNQIAKDTSIVNSDPSESAPNEVLPIPPMISIDGQLYMTGPAPDQPTEDSATVPSHSDSNATQPDLGVEVPVVTEVSAEHTNFIESLIDNALQPESEGVISVDIKPEVVKEEVRQESLVLGAQVDTRPESDKPDRTDNPKPVKDLEHSDQIEDTFKAVKVFTVNDLKKSKKKCGRPRQGESDKHPAKKRLNEPDDCLITINADESAILDDLEPVDENQDLVVGDIEKPKRKRGRPRKGDTNYFFSLDKQMFVVDNAKKSKGKFKEPEDESVYPFTVGGVEIPKGYRLKTFTIAQRKDISKGFEPERIRANICLLCKLVYFQKPETHLKLNHSELHLESNMMRYNQFQERMNEIITRFNEQGTELDISCPMCEKDFSSFEYMDHLANSHSDLLQTEGVMFNVVLAQCIKNHVSQEWREEPHIANLRRVIGSHTTVCPLCDKLQAKRALHYHLNNYCSVNVLRTDHFTCKECMHIALTQEDLFDHHQKYHSKRKYVCQFCGSEYDRKQVYYQHLRLKHNHGRMIPKEPMLCQVEGCKYKTHHENRMKIHVERKHSTEKAHLCEHCGQSFKCRPYLITHYLSAHPHLKQFYCRRCKKGYRVMEAYRRHITACYDLADPSNQIEFKSTDAIPLNPEECKDHQTPQSFEVPPPMQVISVPKEESTEQQELLFILQDENGGQSVIENWSNIENAQLTDSTILHEGAVDILPDQEHMQEALEIVSQVQDPESESQGNEVIIPFGNELGEIPVGTQILVYMDGAKNDTKFEIIQENVE